MSLRLPSTHTSLGYVDMLFMMVFYVLCRNGVSRAGVYCALSICVEQHRASGEIDIFNAVRTVKRNRPQLVENVVRCIKLP